MKFVAAIAGAIAVVVVVVLARQASTTSRPPRALLFSVPVERAAGSDPTRIEVWEYAEGVPEPKLQAWRADQRQPMWEMDVPHDVDWIRQSGHRRPFVRVGSVIVVPTRKSDDTATLTAIDLVTGRVAWKTPLTSRGLRWKNLAANRELVVVVATAFDDRTVAVGLDASTGKALWQTDFPGRDRRIGFHKDAVVLASTAGAFAMASGSASKHQLTTESGDIAMVGNELMFVGRSISRIESHEGVLSLRAIGATKFPADAQREVLATCGGMVVRVTNKGRGLVAVASASGATGWRTEMPKSYDVLHAGASIARWPVVEPNGPEPAFLPLWIDMGYRPRRGRLVIVNCADGSLSWLGKPVSPTLVQPPAFIGGDYYVRLSAPGGGEHAPPGFEYPPDPIAVIDGASGRLIAAVAAANDQNRQEAVGRIYPWRVREGWIYQDTETTAPWQVRPRDCTLSSPQRARTCVSVLPFVHALLGLRPSPGQAP